LLDPGDEDEGRFLIEAQHLAFADALRSDEDVIVDGEPVNPRLHVAMHQVVANQLLSDDPPETWHTVQRLAGMGYDWHNIMHMIASLVTEDVYRALNEHRYHDPASYARRLNELPGDWPPPEPAPQGHSSRRECSHVSDTFMPRPMGTLASCLSSPSTGWPPSTRGNQFASRSPRPPGEIRGR
jgi:hypothetical protein